MGSLIAYKDLQWNADKAKGHTSLAWRIHAFHPGRKHYTIHSLKNYSRGIVFWIISWLSWSISIETIVTDHSKWSLSTERKTFHLQKSCQTLSDAMQTQPLVLQAQVLYMYFPKLSFRSRVEGNRVCDCSDCALWLETWSFHGPCTGMLTLKSTSWWQANSLCMNLFIVEQIANSVYSVSKAQSNTMPLDWSRFIE